MGKGDRGLIVHDLDRLLRQGVEPPGDGDLLERFQAGRDEAAFETLVTRHGPMVRGVCRRLLRDPHDADDAFQATFLVLARKGDRLRDPDRLGPWLYGVATRVASRARARAFRRRGRPLTDDLPARDDHRSEWSDVLPILDAELARLPSAQRDVLVVCLLGGASEQEASRRLACPVGTVKSRLSRAREALRGRLVKRGVAPAAALVAASSVESFASPVSFTLLRATLAATTAKAAIPASVAALTQGVAPTMLAKPILTGLALAGGLCLLTLTATAWPPNPPEALQDEAKTTARPTAAASPSEANLKRILLALHNYYSTNECFPPAAIRGADGRPLLSWRVALLPYLEAGDLYNQFRLNEPWNSPHNGPLLARMPAVFDTPGIPAPPGETRFRGVSSQGAMFGPPGTQAATSAPTAGLGGGVALYSDDGAAGRGPVGIAGTPGGAAAAPLGDAAPAPAQPEPPPTGRGVSMTEVTDGTSNTAMVLVVEDAIEWTRPGELLAVGDELPALEDSDPRGYTLGMADGSVQHLPKQPIRRAFLSALITRNGGEVIDHSRFAPTSLQPAAAAGSTPPPMGAPTALPTPAPAAQISASPTVERRLRRVEEKLDEILDRLDALAPKTKR
ncbi:sigma-70 family RNA polymerase sigma factor [Paludisphaera mucosa]|uniref:Sigma-70 family RNA polymerase sigma factor n=1 Tax=Paludisphaera mucosa TaxID=3030827 RepID=A0ABT6FHM1_9BACT|nr:sigma-70 family RNA polymerase sigma factor [Paludisphaera mucosa]MDG3007039.1 sigma-70 family RNA polymerase sigma factor [Paludisphaera mucosa]